LLLFKLMHLKDARC